MKFTEESLLLYLVTDRSWLKGEELSDVVKASIQAGVTFVQLREKDMDYSDVKKEALKLKNICREFDVPFVINDYVSLAVEMDADGVHIGQSDMEAQEVRAMLAADKILGVSVQTVEQAIKAEKAGASYLGVGAVFPTNTKAEAKPLDMSTLQTICEAVNIPVVAIGGITKENVHKLQDAKINGVAVVSAILAQEDIKTATTELKSICQKVFQG